MTQNVTSRELIDLIKEVRPHVEEQNQEYLVAANQYVVAKRKFELAEADAFLKAKKDGATDEMAKRIALIRAADEKQEMELRLEEKRAASLGSKAWQSVLEAYAAASHVLNRELKAFSA